MKAERQDETVWNPSNCFCLTSAFDLNVMWFSPHHNTQRPCEHGLRSSFVQGEDPLKERNPCWRVMETEEVSKQEKEASITGVLKRVFQSAGSLKCDRQFIQENFNVKLLQTGEKKEKLIC